MNKKINLPMPLSFIIILICIGVFFLELIFGNILIYYGALRSEFIFSHPWMYITHMFLHSSPSHLIFNMFGLFFFGPFLERRVGLKNFALIYFGGGILAAFGGVFVYNIAIGASAAVMSIIGATIVFYPNLRVFLFFAIPMKLWQVGILYLVLDLFGLVVPNSVANFAHLIGFFFGIVFALYLKKKYFPKKNKKIEEEFEVLDASEYMKKHS